MDNQHRLISGYRELNAEEIALVNTIKAHAAAGEALVEQVRAHLNAQLKGTVPADGDSAAFLDLKKADVARMNAAEPGRWASIARTDMQTANMALVRAVTQPTTF